MSNLLDQISALKSELSRSESKVATAVLDDPQLTMHETIGQLSERSGVSQPTICRFAKNFGVNGFPAFKELLRRSMANENNRNAGRIQQGDSVEDVVAKVVDNTISSINDMARSLDMTVLARVIDLFSQAKRIVIIAAGLSTAAALDCALRLQYLGLPCELVTDAHMMQLSCASLRQGDLLAALSATGRMKCVLQGARQARQNGVSVVAIAPPRSPLAELASLNLKSAAYVDSSKDDLMVLRTSQMTLLQIVLAGVRLRRADTIKLLRGRLDEAGTWSYLGEDDPDGPQEQQKPAEGLRAGEPITPLNLTWPV